MTTGYSLRNTPTIVDQLNEGFDAMFKLNRQKRRSYDDFQREMDALSQLSGKRDVSQEDLTDEQIKAAFAESYALAECADGRAREQRKEEINE